MITTPLFFMPTTPGSLKGIKFQLHKLMHFLPPANHMLYVVTVLIAYLVPFKNIDLRLTVAYYGLCIDSFSVNSHLVQEYMLRPSLLICRLYPLAGKSYFCKNVLIQIRADLRRHQSRVTAESWHIENCLATR